MVVVAVTGAFENVPRRRRSAGAAGTGVHGSGASQASASADDGAAEGACQEQPSSSSSSSRGIAGPVDQAERQGRRQVEEPPVAQNASADPRRNVSPAPSSRNDEGAAAPPARSNEPFAPSSSSSATARVKDAEELRRRKGKMPAQDQSLPEPIPRNAAAAAPVKLLGDAIRCRGHGNAWAAAAPASRPKGSTTTTSSKRRKDRGAAFWFSMGGEGQSTSSAGSDMDVSLDRIPVASALLRAALSDLGVAARPVRVYGKMMTRSDRTTQQARLLLSCKSWHSNNNDGDEGDGEPFPLEAFMTQEEVRAARGAGLHVLAYDRAGATYDGMKLRYLPSNTGYRVIGNWGHFLRGNGLVDTSSAAKGAMDVLVDLWLFRCPKGNLGIVLIHYRRGDAAHADAAFEEEDAERMRKNTRREPADVEVDCSAAEDDGMEVDDEDVGVDGVVVDDGVAMQDIVMEDVAYDAVTEERGAGGGGGELPSTLPSSDAIGVTLVLEVTAGSQEEPTVPLASSDANNVKAEKNDASGTGKKLAAPSPPDAGGTNEVDEAGVQGEQASPSPFNMDDAKAEVHAPPSSGYKEEEETAEQGRAAGPVSSLSGYKQEVIEAAKTLMLISQGFW